MLTGETGSCYQVTQEDAVRKVASALLEVTETTAFPVDYSANTKALLMPCVYSKMLVYGS